MFVYCGAPMAGRPYMFDGDDTECRKKYVVGHCLGCVAVSPYASFVAPLYPSDKCSSIAIGFVRNYVFSKIGGRCVCVCVPYSAMSHCVRRLKMRPDNTHYGNVGRLHRFHITPLILPKRRLRAALGDRRKAFYSTGGWRVCAHQFRLQSRWLHCCGFHSSSE